MKVRVFLKSGNHLDVECECAEFDNNYLTKITSYKFTKPKGNLYIDVNQIEAWQTIVK
jgi:hypothetical protein